MTGNHQPRIKEKRITTDLKFFEFFFFFEIVIDAGVISRGEKKAKKKPRTRISWIKKNRSKEEKNVIQIITPDPPLSFI